MEARDKVKAKAPRQTVCNIPTDNPKEPYCGGKLKRITELDPAASKEAGKGKDVFRCQKCKTLYVEESPYAVAKGK
jgi:uncharacterized protein with PIN domain